jgi:hypothetical protein
MSWGNAIHKTVKWSCGARTVTGQALPLQPRFNRCEVGLNLFKQFPDRISAMGRMVHVPALSSAVPALDSGGTPIA